MADNLYSTLIARLVTELQTLTQYPGLIVSPRVFRAAALPAFDTYAIIVSPASHPWYERQTAIREVQYIFKADLFLLVKNFHDSDALFGTVAPDLGLFQFIHDAKELLRQSTLAGLIDKTYTEAAGSVEVEDVAAMGFDSAEYSFVHRAKIPYEARMAPFCFPVASPL